MPLIADPRERSTAATDVLISVLALRYAAQLLGYRAINPWKVGLWSATFGGLALAGGLGAAAHGLTLSERARAAIWRPLYLTLSAVVALFAAGALRDGWGEPAARRALPPLLLAALGFFAISQRLRRGFIIFIVYEAVAMLFAFGVYVRLARGGRLAGADLMAAGVLLSILAAAVQASQLEISILGVPFDHNGLFHLVQIAGLPLLAAGLRAALN
jgi:hypothetical protein